MKKYHVYGVGNALVDMEFEVNDDFLKEMDIGKGLMTLVDEHRQLELLAHLGHENAKWASGGSAANTLIAVSHFGGKAFYSCKVANDEAGDFYIKDLEEARVDSNINGVEHDGTTGRCMVMVTPDAERTMNTYLGITETLSPTELNESAIMDSHYLYIEGYLVSSTTGLAAAIEARKLANQHATKTALTFSDPAMVQYFRKELQSILGDGIDFLFCNEGEALAWAETESLTDAMSQLKLVAKNFVVTRGGDGALVFDGKETIQIAANKVNAIDTNGAGDMFAGAFLYALTHGYSPLKAGELASLASARVVSQFGPRLEAEAHKELLDQLTT